MNSIYIIFLNDEIKGYLSDKTTTIQRVNSLSEKLTEEERQKYSTQVRIVTEQKDGYINIYAQQLGRYIDGFVELKHTIKWKELTEYKTD